MTATQLSSTSVPALIRLANDLRSARQIWLLEVLLIDLIHVLEVTHVGEINVHFDNLV